VTEQEIRSATPEELRAMVADVLHGPPDAKFAYTFGLRNVYRVDGELLDVWDMPDWPNDIAAAWELPSGDGWYWEMGNNRKEEVWAQIWTYSGDDIDLRVEVAEPWRGSEAMTYATARTRAWLLAKLAEEAA